MSSEDELRSSDNESLGEPPFRSTATASKKKFTSKQQAVLSAFYNTGMKGVGEVYSSRISQAAREAGLKIDQVKRWIKRKNYRKKHSKFPTDAVKVVPVTKMVKLTPWQVFLKDFGSSHEGKEVMKKGTKQFSLAASNAYSSKSLEEKQELKKRCCESSKTLTAKNVKQTGRKVFKTINMQVQQLQGLGYSAFAFGIFEEDVQFVSSTDASICSHPKVIQFLTALIGASNPPQIDDVISEFLSTGDMKTGAKDQTRKRKMAANSPAAKKGKVVANASSLTKKSKVVSYFKKRKMTPSHSTLSTDKYKGPGIRKQRELGLLSLLTSTSDEPPPSMGNELPPSTSNEPPPFPSDGPPPSTNNEPPPSPSDEPPPSTNNEPPPSPSNEPPPSTKNEPPPSPSDEPPPSSNNELPPSPSDEPPPSTSNKPPTSNDPPTSNEPPSTSNDLPLSVSNHQPTPTTSSIESTHIVISSSPVKDEHSYWLRNLDLTFSDKLILQTSSWLNDSIIFAAQCLLREQSNGRIQGWKSTQCSKRIGEEKFPCLPPNSAFVQVLHVAGSHWITTSNIDSRQNTHYRDTVSIYDSALAPRVSASTKQTICQFLKPSCDVLLFDIMNIQTQPNLNDCGLFALACATELVHGFDPVLCSFNTTSMRPHLLACLEAGYISRFPCTKRRRVPFGSRVRKTCKESIYCICRMPNDKSKPMIRCDQCRKWFHKKCENVREESYKGQQWNCTECQDFIQSLN